MTMRELGPYLLLRQLSEDALSETYRAGQRSGEDVERVVLLYRFKADAEAAHWLADTATVGHRALKGLNSHTIATVVDSGEIDDTAYLAYDYISGIRLNQLFEESRNKGIPLPMDLALLIADRLAQGLLDAWEHESRMLHGFLVPHLVMISTEGDARVLGIEVAGRLRRLLTEQEIHDEVRPYLGPEVVPESQASTIDDVYSLGALLFELTTGTQPPPASSDGVGDVIAEATAADGSEIPPDVRSLLESSLAKSMRRIDLKTWHSELSDLIVSGQYEASPFSLALFLHRLFGDDLEEGDGARGSDSESESEASLAQKKAQAAALQNLEAQLAESDEPKGSDEENEDYALAAEEPVLGDIPEPVVPSDELASDEFFADVSDSVAAKLPPPVADTPSTGLNLKLAAAAALVLIAVVIGFFFMRGDSESEASGPIASQMTETELPVSEEIAGTDTRQVAEPDDDTTTKAASKAQRQASQLPKSPPPSAAPAESGKSLQGRPATSIKRTAPAQNPAREVAAPTVTNNSNAVARDEKTNRQSPASGVAEEALAQVTYEKPSADRDTESTRLNTPAEQPPVATPAVDTTDRPTGPAVEESEPATEDPEPVVSQQLQSVPQQPTINRPGKSEPAAEKAKRVPPPTEKVAEPVVQTGQLVSPGPGVTPPRLAKSIQPAYPIMARRLNKKATVSLRVLIDETGKVLEVEPMGQPAGYGFDEAAVGAAEKTLWDPPAKNGVSVKMWWTIRIDFQP